MVISAYIENALFSSVLQLWNLKIRYYQENARRNDNAYFSPSAVKYNGGSLVLIMTCHAKKLPGIRGLMGVC